MARAALVPPGLVTGRSRCEPKFFVIIAYSWFNRFRKLLIRWENKPQNYLALVQCAAVLIVWRLVG